MTLSLIGNKVCPQPPLQYCVCTFLLKTVNFTILAIITRLYQWNVVIYVETQASLKLSKYGDALTCLADF